MAGFEIKDAGKPKAKEYHFNIIECNML